MGKKVYGALYNISKLDERRLDIYEDYPTLYTKMYFKNNNKLIMTYLMKKKQRELHQHLAILTQSNKVILIVESIRKV